MPLDFDSISELEIHRGYFGRPLSILAYQSQSRTPKVNSKEAAGFLAGINEQTPSEENLWIKIIQLRIEQNEGKAHRLLQSRLVQTPFASEHDKSWE
jgi:hypothetical protein